MKRTIAVLMALGLIGCVIAPQVPPTPAEITFSDKSVAEVQTLLIGLCARGGLAVNGQTANTVSCEREVTDQSFFAALLLGSDASTNPIGIIQYVTIPQGGKVLVTWTLSIRAQMKFGQTKTVPVESYALNRQMREGLIKYGADSN